MSGYIGTKAVFLSTTAASVTGNADIGGDLTVDTSTLFVDSTNNFVGFGTTTAPSASTIKGVFAGNGAYTQWTRTSTTIAGSYAGTDGNGLVFGTHTGDVGSETYAERMRITSTGSVGIGTSSPWADLSLPFNAGLSFGSSAYPLTISRSGAGQLITTIADGYDSESTRIDFVMRNGHAGQNTALSIAGSGNVGIGTSSPDAKLTVGGGLKVFESALSDSITISVNTTSAYASTITLDDVGLSFDHNSSSRGYRFSTNGTEAMRIDSVGRFLVGRTTTSAGGSAYISTIANGTAQFGIAIKNISATSSNAMEFRNSSDTVIGSIAVSATATGYNTSSDYRLKEDVQPMTGASDRVLALNPVNFAWKSDGTRVDGFLAHEAQAVVPEAVTGTKDAMRTEEYEVTPAVEATYDEDGNELTPYVPAVMGTREVPEYQGIDQSKLVPLLTAALQEALNEIAALKDRVAALETV